MNLYKNRVNHKLYDWKYFKNLTDDEKDKTYYRINGPDSPTINYKQFIIEQPKIRLQLTDYIFDLIKEEMFFDNFHNISYKKVSNGDFHERLKKTNLTKFRFYYQNKWITLYFNNKSKSMVMESDFACCLTVYAGFPKKGLTNFLKKPCMFENPGIGGCKSSDWAACTWLNLSYEEDYCYLSRTGNPNDPTSMDKPCFVPPKNVRVGVDSYFYVKPGEKDNIIEAFTIDPDKGNYIDMKCPEYYILDRDGDYFKKGTTNWGHVKDFVLNKFNTAPNRIELFRGEPGEDKIIAYKTDKTYSTPADLFNYLGRSWVGRINAFFLQWNKYIGTFTDATDGFYCPPTGNSNLPTPPVNPEINPELMNLSSGTLLQETIPNYVPPKLNIETLEDIKILTYVEYSKFDIAADKWLERIDINGNTEKEFKKYAVTFFTLKDKY